MTYVPSSPEEVEFLNTYDPVKYAAAAFTADIVMLTFRNGELSVLLVKRGGYPYKDCWALPGGFVNADEDADQAARRELAEETNITVDKVHLEQIRTYSTPGRDPRMRIISTAYLALLPEVGNPLAGDDAAEAHFFPVKDILNPQDEEDAIQLAFDHEVILRDGLERAASKLEYTPLATAFLEEPFTLADLRRVYETVWGTALHAANFRRKVLSTPNFVVPVGDKGESQFAGGRSADLYRSGTAELLHPAILRKGLDAGIHDESKEEGGL